jgi:hypothetical protein
VGNKKLIQEHWGFCRLICIVVNTSAERADIIVIEIKKAGSTRLK